MHYPRKLSKLHRKRRQGFRARMQTPSGRKLIKRQRAKGRRVGLKD